MSDVNPINCPEKYMDLSQPSPVTDERVQLWQAASMREIAEIIHADEWKEMCELALIGLKVTKLENDGWIPIENFEKKNDQPEVLGARFENGQCVALGVIYWQDGWGQAAYRGGRSLGTISTFQPSHYIKIGSIYLPSVPK